MRDGNGPNCIEHTEPLNNQVCRNHTAAKEHGDHNENVNLLAKRAALLT